MLKLWKRITMIGLITILFSSLVGLSNVKDSTDFLEGAWIRAWPDARTQNVESFNQMTNSQADIIHTFVNADQPFHYYSKAMDYVDSQGAINLITIEPNGYTTSDINQKNSTLS